MTNNNQGNKGWVGTVDSLKQFSKRKLIVIILFSVAITGLLLISLRIFLASINTVYFEQLEKSASILSYSLGLPIAILSALVAIILAMASLDLSKRQVNLENNKLITDIYEESSLNFKRLIRHLGKISRVQLELEESYLHRISNVELIAKMRKCSFLEFNELASFHENERLFINEILSKDEGILRIIDSMKTHLSQLVDLLIKINENHLSRRAWASSFKDVNQQIDSVKYPGGVFSERTDADRFKEPPPVVYQDLSSIISYIEYMHTQITAEPILNSFSEVFEAVYQMVRDGDEPETCTVLDAVNLHRPSNSSPVHLLADAGEKFLLSYTLDFMAIEQHEVIHLEDVITTTGVECIYQFTFKTGRELFLKMLHYIPESELIKKQIEFYMADIGHSISSEKILDVIDDFTKNNFFFFGVTDNDGVSGQDLLCKEIDELDDSVSRLNTALKNHSPSIAPLEST